MSKSCLHIFTAFILHYCLRLIKKQFICTCFLCFHFTLLKQTNNRNKIFLQIQNVTKLKTTDTAHWYMKLHSSEFTALCGLWGQVDSLV